MALPNEFKYFFKLYTDLPGFRFQLFKFIKEKNVNQDRRMVLSSALKNLLVVLIVLVVLETYVFLRNTIGPKSVINYQNTRVLLETRVLRPFCNCSSTAYEYILIERYSESQPKTDDYFSINLIRRHSTTTKTLLYNLTLNQLQNYHKSCDLYNVLKRGKHQRVISYSLYGSNPKYSRNLEKIPDMIRAKYPNFTARVYYDSSVNQSIRCDLECRFQEVIDFCNIDSFTDNLNEIWDPQAWSHRSNLSYMHKMMWRFLPSGDSFVDVFMSRDSDSFFTDREVDSVREWLQSNKYGHIMRGIDDC